MPIDPVTNDLDIARRALSERDAKHAIRHLAGALAAAPFDEHVHAAFESIAQQTDILQNLPDDNFYGTGLVKAFALRRARRVDEAVIVLAQIAEFFPDRRYESLLASWLVALSAEGRMLSEDASNQVARLLGRVCGTTIGINRLLPGEQESLQGFGDLADALTAVSTSRLSHAVAAGLLRRVGRSNEALKLLEPGAQARDENVLIQRGLALRAKGDFASAAQSFEAAFQVSGDDKNLIVEQGRCWFLAGEFERARSLLTAVGYTEDPEAVALLRACEARPEADRLAILDGIRRSARAFDLEMPWDATANIFREHGAKFTPGTARLTLAIRGWESPSNRLLAALYATGTNDVPAAQYTADWQKLPYDPSSHRRGSEPPLWKAAAGILIPAPPPPSDELRAAVGRIAVSSSTFGELWDRAAALARGLDARAASDIAAAMVHPPQGDEWLKALPQVLFRHQIAAACVLANLPDGWHRTRSVFETLIFGPVDWVGAAAIVALGELARRDATRALEVRSLLYDVVGDLVPHSCEPRFTALNHALRTLPCVSGDVLNKLEAWEKEHLPQEEEAAPPKKEAEPARPQLSLVPPVSPGPSVSSFKWGWVLLAAVAALALFVMLR